MYRINLKLTVDDKQMKELFQVFSKLDANGKEISIDYLGEFADKEPDDDNEDPF